MGATDLIFLNKFALTCDDKLRQVHNRIQRLEITMNILEAKLHSIEGLDDVRVESTPSSVPPPPPAPSSHSAPAASPQEEDVQPVARAGGMRNKEDPRYSKYFKLISVGVPLAQVQNKMMLEGVPPSVLDDPEGLSGGDTEVTEEVDFGEPSEGEEDGMEEWDD